MFRFITKNMHAYIDYPVALGLIVMPFILGVGASSPLALWLSVITGIAAFFLTLVTDHRTGVFRIVPYKVHLAVDFAVGVTFVLAAILLGFSGLDFWYFALLGLTVLAVVGLHKSESEALVNAAA